MVEQDYLISRAVALIFADKFLIGQVAMRGGTILHKGHLAPASRYSEDIDLVRIGDRPASSIKKALNRVLKPLFENGPSESILTRVTLAVRNVTMRSQIIRQTYNFDPIDRQSAIGQLKVEANVNEVTPYLPIVPVTMNVPDGKGAIVVIDVPSYGLNEMLGTKLRALLQREHGRDLYDLWRAWEVTQAGGAAVDPTIVGDAFRFYMDREGSKIPQGWVASEVARRMQSPKFTNDMKNYLPLGVAYSPNEAYDVFQDFYLPHLP
ncbi:nucleotidyl transferase AbiEii/AbiGii toxin family protein [Caballeronia sordidicola]|nr:nucleotidyl transferase AbiEii/AbiGii toxin family protein [Caballeronia sordidicola]